MTNRNLRRHKSCLLQFILLLTIGIVFLVIGWLIWKKEKITLIHSYHYNKVSDTNKRAYTALVGKGTLIIGTGIIVTGIIDLITQTGWGWIVFGVSFFVGLGFMAYQADGNVLYQFNIVGEPDEQTQVKNTLEQVVNSFNH